MAYDNEVVLSSLIDLANNYYNDSRYELEEKGNEDDYWEEMKKRKDSRHQYISDPSIMHQTRNARK